MLQESAGSACTGECFFDGSLTLGATWPWGGALRLQKPILAAGAVARLSGLRSSGEDPDSFPP